MSWNNNGQGQGNGQAGRLFVNTVSLGTGVTVNLNSGATVTGTYMGMVAGMILINTTYVEPNEIVSFSLA